MSKFSDLKFQTLQISFPATHVIKVAFNRPKKFNVMNPKFFIQLQTCFNHINNNKQDDIRAVIFIGNGKHFCGGFDMQQFQGDFQYNTQNDIARTSVNMYNKIQKLQQSFLSIFNCRLPVLFGIHGNCVSTGLDIACMADIRYSTQNAKFMMKQIDLGMTPDAGTLQIFPQISKSHSFFRQILFTGKIFDGKQALEKGFVSKIFKNQNQLFQNLLITAKVIAQKSPIGIWTIKQVLTRQMKLKVEEGLQYARRTNSGMLLTKDIKQSILAMLGKRRPIYSKL